jgi:hypothetical protein
MNTRTTQDTLASVVTLKEEAECLLSYWDIHGDSPETVAKWAVSDMLGILRFITEDDES